MKYTLGLFANAYPAFDEDYRANFIGRMVKDLEARGVVVKKAVKTSASVSGYIPYYSRSVFLSRSKEPDIMQAEYIPHSSIIPALIKRRRIPLVLRFHGDDALIYPFENQFNLILTRQMIRLADYIVTPSEAMRKVLIDLGAEPDLISAIHTGIDTEFFTPRSKEELRRYLDLPQDASIFIFVGRLHHRKGISELLNVALLCPHIWFIFIGPGSVPEHPCNCIFVGEQPQWKVRDWLSAADCCVLPTYSEGIPATLMESFACGTPAITTNVGGCPEIVEHNKNGLLVRAGDTRSLMDAVLWMHDHPGERGTMGRQARITAVEKFDHNVLIEKLMSVHQGLMSRN